MFTPVFDFRQIRCELRHLRSVLSDLISRQNQISHERCRENIPSSTLHTLDQLLLHLQLHTSRVKSRIAWLQVPQRSEAIPADAARDSDQLRDFSPLPAAKSITVDFARFARAAV